VNQRVLNFNVELHCHTLYSKDGLIRLDSLARTAARVGLNALAVTDHDTIEGAREFSRWVKGKGVDLHVIVGEEKTLADGTHFIGLFLHEPIASEDLANAILEIEAQGGLCLAPHPFRKNDGVLRNTLEALPLLQKHHVGYEAFNGKCSFADNQKTAQLRETLCPFVGSDAHYESDLGESLNVIAWEKDLKASVERMLRNQGPCRLLGRPQEPSEAERVYAPLYYKMKRFLRVPRPLLPAAKQCYRWYRNRSRGIGLKPLVEIYDRS
jgi:hypothetical protein